MTDDQRETLLKHVYAAWYDKYVDVFVATHTNGHEYDDFKLCGQAGMKARAAEIPLRHYIERGEYAQAEAYMRGLTFALTAMDINAHIGMTTDDKA